MNPSACPRCASPIPAGPRPRFCTACGGALPSLHAQSRKLPLLLIVAGAAALGLFVIAGVFLRGAAEKKTWEEKKAAALAAARSGSAGLFRRSWDEATAAAAAKPERLAELRVALERQLAADFPAALAQLRGRGPKMATEALVDWKCLWSANLETPDSEDRRARERNLRALGIDIAQAAAQAEIATSRFTLAFDRHRTACDLCSGTTDPDARRRIHLEMEAPLAKWLEANRDAIAAAVASKDDLRIAEAAGPGAEILAGLRAHESGPGGRGAPSWSPDFVRSYEEVFASVPTKRVVVTVLGDPGTAALIRQLCTVSFPCELVFRTFPTEAAAAAAPPAGDGPAWLTVHVAVDWQVVDYKKTSGLTFAGDYRLPVGVSVSCSVYPAGKASCPWPQGPWERELPSPGQLEVRGRDDAERKADFDRQKDARQRSLETDLRAYLSGWKPWMLPARKDR